MSSPDQILEYLGTKFVEDFNQNRALAWRNLQLGIMQNLAALAIADVTQPLRDIIGIAQDIDKSIGKEAADPVKAGDEAPLDKIARHWRRNNVAMILNEGGLTNGKDGGFKDE